MNTLAYKNYADWNGLHDLFKTYPQETKPHNKEFKQMNLSGKVFLEMVFGSAIMSDCYVLLIYLVYLSSTFVAQCDWAGKETNL
jgi:hypothetical protein